jgi:hypothetical protein
MTTHKWKVLVPFALAATTMMVLAVVDPALAQTTTNGGSTTDIGKNLGDEVSSWAKALLLGVAALVGLPALAKRDLGQSMVVALITIVLGGFIFAGDTVESIIHTMWTTLGQ